MADKNGSDLIFVIGRQRSGTTVFRQLLVNHGAMNADEILHGDLSRPHRFYAFVRERMKQNPSLLHPMKHPPLFQPYIDQLRVAAKGAPIVLDLKYFAINLIPSPEDVAARRPFILQYIAQTQSNVFHITRRNKLRVLVSERIAVATGAWSAQHPHQLPPDRQPLHLEIDTITRWLDRMAREDQSARQIVASLPKCRELVYEEMFEANGNFTDEVAALAAAALGRDSVNATPTNLRMNPEPLPELLTNYDEIAGALHGTHNAWMLTA